ncbi:hypothetical protein [Gluconobacter kondonii]|uniref:hypothetical protein n=1 Tax=Gluconobacter kondonii TaxID=941463 RepID=UPI001B8B62B9|nr:hypothetical protein [Gluconobacter kondonii]MBS1082543.1 hypothetical protein [Gluconobacter kondonii]
MNKSVQASVIAIAFIAAFPFWFLALPHIGSAISNAAPEDGWNKFLEEWFKAIAPLGSIAIGWMMWRIAKTQQQISTRQLELTSSQHALAKSQFDLSKQQANISFEQKEIARNKYLLDKHSKQYEVIMDFCESKEILCSSLFTEDFSSLKEKYDDLIIKTQPIKFLFGVELYQKAHTIRMKLFDIIEKRLDVDLKKITKDEYNNFASSYFNSGDGEKYFVNVFLAEAHNALSVNFNAS